MSCAEVRPRLGELLVGALAGEELETILAHVEGCTECGLELGELQALEEALSAPAARETEKVEEIVRPSAARSTRIGRRLWLGPALAAAALLAALALTLRAPDARILRGRLAGVGAEEPVPLALPLSVEREDTRLALADGSVLSAGAGARLLLIDRRSVLLLEGRAAFSIASEETPFVLHTPRGQARALGARAASDGGGRGRAQPPGESTLGTTFQVEVSKEQDMTKGAKASAAVTVVTLAVTAGVVLFVPKDDQPAVRVEAGQVVVAGPGGVKRVEAAVETESREQLQRKSAELEAKADALAEQKAALEAELAKARAEVVELRSQVGGAGLGGEPAPVKPKKLPVAYGKWAESELLKNADWKEMAGAMDEMLGMMPELYEKLAKGEGLGAELTQRLGRENTKLLKFAIETMGKLPTNAKSTGNGPFTHPIVIANLVVEHLKLAKEPLSEAQLWELHGLGARYDDEWERAAAGYTKETYTLQRILDELTLKKAFYEGMVALLIEPQRTIVVRPTIHHKAGLDVYSPVLMLTGVGLPAAGASLEELKPKLLAVASSWGFDDAELQSAGLVFDTWLSDLGALTPHVGADVNFYTLDDAMTALRAQLKAMRELETRLGAKDTVHTKLREESTFRVPRLTGE